MSNGNLICAYCRREIHYGDLDAKYYQGNIFCDCECVANYVGADEWDWSDCEDCDDEKTKCVENGFGIKLAGEGYFSNGVYVIFDKFDKNRFRINSEDYEDYPKAKEMLKDFEVFGEKFVTIDRSSIESYADIFDKKTSVITGIRVNYDLLNFVLDYISNNSGMNEFQAFGDQDRKFLYIKHNKKKAVIAGICDCFEEGDHES